MIPALRHLERLRVALAGHPIHQPMLAIDPPRLPARQIAAERFGLPAPAPLQMPLHIHRLVEHALDYDAIVEHVIVDTVAAVWEAADWWADSVVDRSGERVLGDQSEAVVEAGYIGFTRRLAEVRHTIFKNLREVGIRRFAELDPDQARRLRPSAMMSAIVRLLMPDARPSSIAACKARNFSSRS